MLKDVLQVEEKLSQMQKRQKKENIQMESLTVRKYYGPRKWVNLNKY